MFLVTAGEMRDFDRTAIEDYGIPGVVLMENAGRSTFQILKSHLDGDLNGIKVSVVAGPGNNGGDGYVIARYLINYGAEVDIFLLAPRDKIRGDALINLEILEKMTSRIFGVEDEEDLEAAIEIWTDSDVIVDAILGTGLSSEVRSPYAEAIDAINRAHAFKLAVDIPSGLDADTGKPLGVAVEADLTATYGFMKLGMSLFPGLEYCGQVEVVDICVPAVAIEAAPPKAILYQEPILDEYYLLRSDPQSHKGNFGHVLVVGGSPGKTGAAAMTAQAASRIGAGLVTVAVPASLNSIFEIKLTEEMSEPIPEALPGYLGEESADRILELLESRRCLALGPGLSFSEGMSGLIKRILSSYSGAVVIDADGLNALVGELEAVARSECRVVLTPHPGEMGRLLGLSARQVQEDRPAAALRLAEETGAWVALKGARTLTASPDGRIFVNTTGNPWMASGGQGDALSGILAGLLAQGMTREQAVPLGVYLHGLAADNVVDAVGPAPVLAGDVIEELPLTLGALGRHPEEEAEESGEGGCEHCS